MKVYEIKFLASVLLPAEEGEGEEETEIVANFFVGAKNVTDALEEGKKYLLDMEKDGGLEEDGYEIIEVLDADAFIVNWNNQEDEFEVTNETPQEDIMEFPCSCKHNIRIVDGWKSMKCPSCDRKIDRNKVIETGNNGKYIFIDV